MKIMKYYNHCILVMLITIVFIMILVTYFYSYISYKNIESFDINFDGDSSACNKTHQYGHIFNRSDSCYKSLMNEGKFDNIGKFSNGDGFGIGGGIGGGMGAGGGGGDGTEEGKICFVRDNTGKQVQGKYNKQGKCIPINIDPYQFCPEVQKLMHDTWKLKVWYPNYDEGGVVNTDVVKYMDIQEYVNDFIRIDNKYNIDCPVSYVP